MRDKSWLESAAERLCLWPRPPGGFGGNWKFGDAKPLSDLVGLVPVTVMESPERMLPPTNSLPPLLCPTPVGLAGDAASLGDTGGGDRGGLSKRDVSGDNEAPGLKVKLGRAGDLDGRSAASEFMLKVDRSWISMADSGRRPVALEKDDGAEAEEGLAGKTNGGFGSGGIVRGECGPENCDVEEVELSSITGREIACIEGSSKTCVLVAIIILSGPTVVAMLY